MGHHLYKMGEQNVLRIKEGKSDRKKKKKKTEQLGEIKGEIEQNEGKQRRQADVQTLELSSPKFKSKAVAFFFHSKPFNMLFDYFMHMLVP